MRTALLLGILLASATAQAGGPTPLAFKDACTDKESWDLGQSVSPNIAKSFGAFLGGEDSFASAYKAAWFLRSAKTLADHLIITYWKARIHQKLGLTHLAMAGFEKVARSAENRGAELTIRFAAISCLNSMRQEMPSMRLRPETHAALLALPVLAAPQQVAIARQAWFTIFREALVQASPTDLEATKRAAMAADRLRDSPAYFPLSRGLWAMKVNKMGPAVGQFRAYLAEAAKTRGAAFDGSDAYVDLARFNMARALFQTGDYRAALAEYVKTPNSFEYYPESLIERSWAALALRKHDDATGPGFQLQTGDMRALAFPGAHETIGISFYELCDYKAAVNEAKAFQKRFARLHKWLFDWNTKAAAGEKTDLYAVLLSVLSGQEKKVPKMLLTSWVRSPVYAALQKELNSLSDQDIAIRKMAAELRNPRSDSAKALGANELPVFSQLMAAAYGDVTRRIADTKVRINLELERRTRTLMTDFSASVVNIGLIEAEAYNALGDKTARKLAGAAVKSDDKEPGLASWDWGSLSGDEMDDAEVWDDEAGAIKGEVKNRCGKRGGK